MPDLILHHYATSPFSEKVRLIFGLKGLAWKSVHIPMIMPKPDVVALTGGYRKTPILQIGADIYCDTALIADVLERVRPDPPLYPDDAGALARTLAQWADTTLFWTMIPYAFQPAALPAMFGNVPPEHIQAFVTDRKAFRNNAPRMPLGDAIGALRIYLQRIDAMLEDGRPYLLGALPTIADFAVYHSIWFIRRTGALAGILDAHRHLVAWTDHVSRIGHGESAAMASVDAVDVARASTPAPIAPSAEVVGAHGIGLGDRVRIAATDYGVDPVEGELVIDAANELAVRRTDSRAGEVVVHFPRVGFGMSRAE